MDTKSVMNSSTGNLKTIPIQNNVFNSTTIPYVLNRLGCNFHVCNSTTAPPPYHHPSTNLEECVYFSFFVDTLLLFLWIVCVCVCVCVCVFYFFDGMNEWLKGFI